MKPRLLLVLLAGVFVAADVPKVDQDKMQGTWTVELAARKGEALPKEKADKIKVTITGNKIVIQDGDLGRKDEATFQLDPSRNPKTMDLNPAGAGADGKVEGIYQVEGDTLKLCWNKRSGPRPAEFAVGKEESRVLLVLKRGK